MAGKQKVSKEQSAEAASPPLTTVPPATERLPEILHRLQTTHPDAKCALDHNNALELLVATILSAQCTDERVNLVTPALFAKYPTADAFAQADRAELEEAVRSTGFYRNKAAHIQQACRLLVDKHHGEVPADMAALLELPGVARKTANVVLGVSYGIAEGVVVDTHVKRLAQRLGFTAETDPEKIERELMELVPHENWIIFSHLLIFHGRRICQARKPDCAHCPLNDLCPSVQM
ncbi:MAG: endonuclease III [Chloroflexi bacterium]|nr:endonuclease III [Chloroflexota bacterium]